MKLFLIFLFLLLSQTTPQLVGVDVSAWQDTINWSTVATTDVRFTMIRASVNRKVDTFFETNYYGALNAGISVAGVYYYTYSYSESECAADADFVITNLNGKKVPVYFDMEESDQADLGQQTVTNMILAFIKRCQNYGYECGLYTSKYWYNNVYYGKQVTAAGAKIWAANWGPDDGYAHVEYKPNIGEICWQYTSKGSVNGISWNVDMDLLYEDVPTPDPEPTPTPTGGEKMVKVVTDVINRRSAPVIDASNIVGSYVYGQHIQTQGITDDKQWYIDTVGYYFTAYSEYVQDLIGVCTADVGLNVRSEPSTSATIITAIPYGGKVAILKKSGEWYYVQLTDGTKGYAHGEYLSLQ